MTVIFEYYQYLSYYMLIHSAIPPIIAAVFTVILNIFILIYIKNLGEEIKKTGLLKSAAIINIIFSILPIALPLVAYSSLTEIERIIIISYLVFLGLIRSLPFFITYGLFFFVFGKTNQERYSSFLKIAGILWMVSFGFFSIILSGWLSPIIYILTGNPPILIITNFTRLMFSIIGLNGFVLLMIHGIKYNTKNLMIAGILGLVHFTTGIFYSIFTSHIPLPSIFL
ncbi:MAG: hypothetical protein ACFFBZ_03490 [Promethearchaeota archaeon]